MSKSKASKPSKTVPSKAKAAPKKGTTGEKQSPAMQAGLAAVSAMPPEPAKESKLV